MELSDFIVINRNAVPLYLRDMILSAYADCKEWNIAAVGTDGVVDTKSRNVSVVHMSAPPVLNSGDAVRKVVDSGLFECANKVVSEYISRFPTVEVRSDSGYDLLRYTEGQYYGRHVDAMPGMQRTLSCAFGINDEYEGGEWEFFGGGYSLRLNGGDSVVFPSNFMFPHAIRPVTAGVRYSVVTWFY